jgi:aminopeptidase N
MAEDLGTDEAQTFHDRWRHDRLVMDKWFAVSVATTHPDRLAATVDRLTAHPDFTIKNPNRFRAVLGAMSGHHAGFHHASGSGYAMLADWLIRLAALNPQTAARMSTGFETWTRYDAGRQAHARRALERILATPGLSRDLGEMAGRLLGAGA